MRHYEVMIILGPDLEEKTIQPNLEAFLNVVRGDGAPSTASISGAVAGWPTRSTTRPKASTLCSI